MIVLLTCLLNVHSGHQIDFYRQTDVGEMDFALNRKYGGAWKIDGCFGVRLPISHAFYQYLT